MHRELERPYTITRHMVISASKQRPDYWFMRHLLHILPVLRRLRWKLTASYVAVTVGTVLLVEVLLLIVLAILMNVVTIEMDRNASPAFTIHLYPDQLMLSSGDVLIAVPEIVLYTTLFLLLPVTTIGTVFGLITSRWITRRLDRVHAVAAAWGQGQFNVQITDQSSDEIGTLSRTLDIMAAQLATLVTTRQRLAALDERNRIALDLHDGVKQQLFAVAMNLGSAQLDWHDAPDEARSHVQLAEAQLHTAQRDLGTLIQSLRPVQVTTSVCDQLRTVTAPWRLHTGITIREVYDDAPVKLPAHLTEVLLRVTQEALANVAKHSGASEVIITLCACGDTIALTIVDNGRGFAPVHPPVGLGLQSMQERALRVGGQCTIQSSTAGTSVKVTIPE
ncbi:MAG: histidine kinase [Chloroflexota bacterium]